MKRLLIALFILAVNFAHAQDTAFYAVDGGVSRLESILSIGDSATKNINMPRVQLAFDSTNILNTHLYGQGNDPKVD